VKINNSVIRAAAEADFPEIIRLVEEISFTAPEKRAQFNWDRFQIRDELHKAHTWVIEGSEALLAFVCVREAPDFFEITVLATRPVSRNQGHQSQLMRQVLNVAKSKKKNVLLEVHEENLSAINFYRKHGFAELPSRKNYYSDGKSALVFIYRAEVT
jgi:ribosomal protein S18 acetylase RimI-like enzyme